LLQRFASFLWLLFTYVNGTRFMYLRELRLHGFKSFADPTRLDLDHGVTAIVGPNGCGKSNIADAIRWVLGEQSAKSLRAGGMQDVIFQGTSNRKPVNLCQVTLVFSNCEDQLGTAHHEVEVSRRVVRDGGSEYFLNGKACRLKDIQRLFLDTGVGQVSYSFMLQGQIDQVLSSNPSERRAIFEEAAGISKYKAQRREALNKLAHVDANLARVTDVIEEVGRQAGSLKRQAAKAVRYQRVHHRLVHLELAHNAFEYAGLKDLLREQREKLENLAAQLRKDAGTLQESEASLARKREEALSLRTRLEESQKSVYNLRTEKDNASNRYEMAAYRDEDVGKRLGEIEQEMAELRTQEEALAEKLAGETRLKQEQMNLFGDSDEEFQRRSKVLTELQQQLNTAEGQLSRAKQALLVKEGAISRLRSNCTSLELELKSDQVRHANLSEEIQGLRDAEAGLLRDQRVLERTRRQREGQRKEQSDHLDNLRREQKERTEQFREQQRTLQEGEREKASLQAQAAMLEDLQAKLEGVAEGAKAILQGKVADVIPQEACTLFLQHVKVAEGATEAVERLLGKATDGIFLREKDALGPLSLRLREKEHGRASLLTPFQVNPLHANNGSTPAGLTPARELVSSDDEAVQAFLDRYLDGCYVAEEVGPVLEHIRKDPGFTFALVATRTGELLDARGLVLAGSSPKKGKNSSFLERRNELKRLREQLQALEDRQERLRLESEQLQKRLGNGEKRLEEQSRLVSETATELATLATQMQSGAKSIDQTRQQRTVKERERAKLEDGKEESTRKLEKAQSELEETESSIRDLKDAIGKAEAEVERLRSEREKKREAFDEVRFEVAEKKQRLEFLDRGLEELQRKSKETESTRNRRAEEKERLLRKREELQAEMKQHAAAGKEIEEKLSGIREALEKDRTALRELEQRIGVLEEGLAPQRERQQSLSSEHNRIEVELARRESRLEFLREECQRDYDRNPAEVDWKTEFWKAGEPLPERIRVDVEETDPDELETTLDRGEPSPEDLAALEPVDWEAVKTEIGTLRSREQSMGPVNIGAIEEYKELKERHAFLRQQSEDLWNSKKELLEAIDEINHTSQTMFAETFAAIRKNFLYTFETLFGGGKADLHLVDAEDVLESGIDITAQPPGTRLRNLALLSGGQKTMTAVALLFAIYMVKPSPFCVLDEIDAPLDDANIGRFTGMLEQFLKYSQFLIITHNKRTISVADTIYGATMQEKGVSRMISMRFNKATGKAEVAEASPPARTE
jgi:chromosome segregation protein